MTNGHNIPPDNLCLSEKLLREYAEKADKIASQSSDLFDTIKQNFESASLKISELQKKNQNGARKTDGTGSFLL